MLHNADFKAYLNQSFATTESVLTTIGVHELVLRLTRLCLAVAHQVATSISLRSKRSGMTSQIGISASALSSMMGELPSSTVSLLSFRTVRVSLLNQEGSLLTSDALAAVAAVPRLTFHGFNKGPYYEQARPNPAEAYGSRRRVAGRRRVE